MENKQTSEAEATQTSEATNEQDNQSDETVTYTKSELEKLISSEADRRTGQARSKWEESIPNIVKEQLQSERESAAKEAEEKTKAQLLAEQGKFEHLATLKEKEAEETKKQLEDLRKQIERNNLLNEVTKLANEKGLGEISDIFKNVNINDIEEAKPLIENIEKMVKSQAESIAKNMLKTPNSLKSLKGGEGADPDFESDDPMTRLRAKLKNLDTKPKN